MNKNSIRSTTIHMQMNNNNAIQYMKMQFYIMHFNEQYTLYALHTTQRNTMHSNEMNNVQRCIPVQEYNTATVDDTPQCNSMLSCKQSIEIALYSSTFYIAVHLKQLTTMQFNAISCKRSIEIALHSSAFYRSALKAAHNSARVDDTPQCNVFM